MSAPTFTWSAAAGGDVYQIQIDDDRRFRSPEQDIILPVGVLSYTANPLLDGGYFWRVRGINSAGVAGPWSSQWGFTIDTGAPGVPVLRSPNDQTDTRDTTPRFAWQRVPGADRYRLQVSSEPGFTSTMVDVYVSGVSYTLPDANALAYGAYHWRVQAGDAAGNWSAWSAPYTFTVTILRAPADGSATTDTTPRFLWYAVAGAVRYELQVDDNADFGSPIVAYTGTRNRYTPTTPLPFGALFWRVRVDTGAGFGSWTPAWRLTVVSTAPQAVEPLQAAEPSRIPLAAVTPNVTPTVALAEPLQVIEAESATVQRTGFWTAQATNRADGGYYIYSSGSATDTLSLTFEGTQVAVMYVQHPALGVFAVEVDGVLMQTVNTAAPESAFGARVAVSGLSPSVHTLRVYPVSGTVAIDAFAVEPQGTVLATSTLAATAMETSTCTPPATPTATETASTIPIDTPEPTETATGTPTAPPTEVATATPIPTATPMVVTPTNTPVPLLLPWVETFDTGLGWTPSGAWQFDVQGAYRGVGWFADSAWRDQVSTLTYDALIDLRLALSPTLSFWQRAVLSAGDAVAVEVSLDDGMSWMALDQQVGLATDWTQRLLDLTAYRGQVIRLRFRLNTAGELPEGATTVGVWVDELLIQDLPPTWTPQPTATPWPTATVVPSTTPTPTETYTPTPSLTHTPTIVPTPTSLPTPTEVPPTSTPEVVALSILRSRVLRVGG